MGEKQDHQNTSNAAFLNGLSWLKLYGIQSWQKKGKIQTKTIEMKHLCTNNLHNNFVYQGKMWVSIKEPWSGMGVTPMHTVPADLPHHKLQPKPKCTAVQTHSCYEEKTCLVVTSSKSRDLPRLLLLKGPSWVYIKHNCKLFRDTIFQIR